MTATQSMPTLNEAPSAETLIALLEHHAALRPDSTYCAFLRERSTDVECRITYGGLAEESRALAAALQARGLRPGERVVLMLPDNRDFLLCFFAVVVAGGVAVPMPPPLNLDRLQEFVAGLSSILDDCTPRFVIATPRLKQVVRLASLVGSAATSFLAFADLDDGDETFRAVGIGQDDPCLIQYTSGTVGSRKGVLSSHRNLIANITLCNTSIRFTPDSVALCWIPLFHDFGLIASVLTVLQGGACLYLMPTLSFLGSPARFLQAVDRYRVDTFPGINFAYRILTQRVSNAELEGLDLSCLRYCSIAAEPIQASTILEFTERFRQVGFRREMFIPAYGLAEHTVGAAWASPGVGPVFLHVEGDALHDEQRAVPMREGTPGSVALVSSGCTHPGHQIRIVDKARKPLPDCRVGEIALRGPSVMVGYFGKPDETRRAVQDGWLHTGDLGFLQEGQLYVVGRSKEMIILGGRNYYPHDLEQLAYRVAGVRRGCAAAFGVFDEARGTEKLVLVVEVRPKSSSARDAIRAAILESVKGFPGSPSCELLLVPPKTVPKTSSGKTQRLLCRRWYLEGKLGKRRLPVPIRVAGMLLRGVGTRVKRMVGR